ncbi:F-box protein SKIP22-like [Aristolochia californica]|uniref:F-box protein SKIP22-like n=1 Tax=Aristolochia californica TaxID=171875 RepID=UPI0035E274D8
MKLRIRSLDSKETLKIQLPSPCSLQDLKCAIADKISSVSESLHLSLNRKDEFVAAPHESLQSTGNSVPENKSSRENKGSDFGGTLQVGASTAPRSEIPVRSLASGEALSVAEDEMDKKRKALQTDGYGFSAGDTSTVDSFQRPYDPGEKLVDMEIDQDSVPGFLKKVLKEEVDKVDGNCNRLLIVAVHGALLESGFVGFDSMKGCMIDGFGLPEGWAGTAKPLLRVEYSVPSLVLPYSSTVALKVVSLGKYVSIYGSVVGSPNVFHINLNASLLAPAIDSTCKRYGRSDECSGSADEKAVFELWKIVKDKLSLPLLMELSEKAGLTPPPCFMRLPVDLKIHILECLPGTDIAKMACVCLELKYLSSNDDLWKKKFVENFPLSDEEVVNGARWKEKFAISCERKKMLTTVTQRREASPGFHQHFPMRKPVPFGSPGSIIGGDCDRLPGFFGGLPFRSGGSPRFPPRRFSPHSLLGGFDV